MIDCESLTVAGAPPQASYGALSYVRGDAYQDLGHDFLRTVRGAIHVANGLSLQYLWMDWYCIKQGSDNEYHQISQMVLVYQAAEIIIVATAETDANHGLLVVQDTDQSRPLSTDIGDYIVVESIDTPI